MGSCDASFPFLSVFGKYTKYYSRHATPLHTQHSKASHRTAQRHANEYDFLTLCRLSLALIHNLCVVYVKCHPDIYLHTDILLAFYLHWPAVDPDVVSFAYLAVVQIAVCVFV